jgi:hypothetical protein
MCELRCKPGDLAVVIYADIPSNVGKIVRVVKASQRDGVLSFPNSKPSWLVQSAHTMTWYIGKKRYRRKTGPVPDAQLQPIRGLTQGRDIADGIWQLHCGLVGGLITHS